MAYNWPIVSARCCFLITHTATVTTERWSESLSLPAVDGPAARHSMRLISARWRSHHCQFSLRCPSGRARSRTSRRAAASRRQYRGPNSHRRHRHRHRGLGHRQCILSHSKSAQDAWSTRHHLLSRAWRRCRRGRRAQPVPPLILRGAPPHRDRSRAQCSVATIPRHSAGILSLPVACLPAARTGRLVSR